MKKMHVIAVMLLAAFVVFQVAAFAGTVEGEVKSVDSMAKKLEVGSADGTSSWVAYSDTTTWPAGVTDPSSLVGKKVKATTDDVTSAATSVEEVSAV